MARINETAGTQIKAIAKTNPPTPSSHQSVLIIGGGLAGLAAASALALRRFQVTVVESRNRLGGRASSFTDTASGQIIDACQHVSMGCCTQFAHFCRSVGIDQFLSPQPTLFFMTPDRRVSRFGADPLPVPFHLARSLFRVHYLTLGDKIRIGWGMLSLLRADPEDDQPLLPWLKKHRQNQRTIDRFWGVVLVSALNESIDRLGLKYARKVFRDGFLGHRKGFEVSIPTVPLARLYGEELLGWFAKQGASIETNAGVRQFEMTDGRISGVQLRDGRVLRADWYISAVPFDRLLDLLPTEVVDSHDEFSRLRNLEVSPITSVHLWFDRKITDLPHVVLVDCLGHWLFNRGEIARGEHYLQVVISASHSLRNLGREEIQRQIVAELAHVFPQSAKATLLRGRVVTEQRATFSPAPGVDRWRPTQKTPIPNLVIAGDWTATGWPATMEGAVRSGYLAAEQVRDEG
jgi:squalene-associated FAD-dependent desaturase